ncbi:MAG: hypothetical protein RID15_10340 [Marinovum algicola]|uniref:Uncharacterized protein n=1 Tax=Marinovum algicola TaxID=42444 RepID=A0A975ZLS6_9RHOB|nr:hypothetical protein [Marinovum algicola]SEI67556.1 hypothetical protein SAMN04487940_101571 [Marinovum algicola]SLN23469.1 hypothetical protein MAA5396_00885 [Marinovum algicola]
MFYELLATIFAGLAGGGLIYGLSRLTRGRIPHSWTIAGAALVMIAFSIWNEYNWFSRSAAQLPDGVVVVAASESRDWYRPWTYALPVVPRFAALDTNSIRRNPDVPQQRIADLYLMERWRAAVGVRIAVDCARPAQARLEQVTYGEEGAMISDSWEQMATDDPLIVAACG